LLLDVLPPPLDEPPELPVPPSSPPLLAPLPVLEAPPLPLELPVPLEVDELTPLDDPVFADGELASPQAKLAAPRNDAMARNDTVRMGE
jgi:hypothetical protein